MFVRPLLGHSNDVIQENLAKHLAFNATGALLEDLKPTVADSVYL
jgi:hypothetical protein